MANKQWQNDWYRKNKDRLAKLRRKRYLKDLEENRKKNREYYYEHHEERLNKSKKWQRENKDKRKIHQKRYYEKSREKEAIRAKARDNIFLNNKLCEKCHKEKAVERHHPDYSKPLEVMLLCKSCHYDVHRIDKESSK